eukprot:3740633-Rhodomonas_salina.1
MPIWSWRAGDGQAADGQDSGAEPVCCSNLFHPSCPLTLTSSTPQAQHHTPAPGELSFAGASRLG